MPMTQKLKANLECIGEKKGETLSYYGHLHQALL